MWFSVHSNSSLVLLVTTKLLVIVLLRKVCNIDFSLLSPQHSSLLYKLRSSYLEETSLATEVLLGKTSSTTTRYKTYPCHLWPQKYLSYGDLLVFPSFTLGRMRFNCIQKVAVLGYVMPVQLHSSTSFSEFLNLKKQV